MLLLAQTVNILFAGMVVSGMILAHVRPVSLPPPSRAQTVLRPRRSSRGSSTQGIARPSPMYALVEVGHAVGVVGAELVVRLAALAQAPRMNVAVRLEETSKARGRSDVAGKGLSSKPELQLSK